MGLDKFHKLVRNKGYDPQPLHQTTIATTTPSRTRRLDLMGSSHRFIRDAYSNNNQQRAHALMEQEASRFGSQANLVIYIDGGQSAEKQHTAQIREASRDKAITKCLNSLETLESRLSNDLRVRKRHFSDVRTALVSSFYWTQGQRLDYAAYMAQAGWNVKCCSTEADLAIAKDCQPGDIVISGDSDMFA
ncbi:hypothetical protein BGX33_002539, partial [Mortierella sp. NVP41]